jgi:hypothetical protein
MTVKTQGTHIHYVSGPTAGVKLVCPTGVSGLNGASAPIDSTCLDALTDKTYVQGLSDPAQLSVPFNLIPTEASHQALLTMKASGAVVNWIVCLSDGTAAPTVVDNQFVAPTGRTSFRFNAFVADVSLDIATNEIVRGTLTLQRSGAVTTTWKTA